MIILIKLWNVSWALSNPSSWSDSNFSTPQKARWKRVIQHFHLTGSMRLAWVLRAISERSIIEFQFFEFFGTASLGLALRNLSDRYWWYLLGPFWVRFSHHGPAITIRSTFSPLSSKKDWVNRIDFSYLLLTYLPKKRFFFLHLSWKSLRIYISIHIR